jgi:hypothetical protein
MKKNYLFVCLVLLGIQLQAQVDGSANTYLNNYVQPSPNAATLGRYADFPISYYTGIPEINVPLYDLKDGAAKVPISLSYHASGIRVAELPTWVGLGWALNAGGMILRTVRGAPDEGTVKSYTTYALGPRSYYRDSGLRRLPLLPYPVGGDMTSLPNQLVMQMFTLPAAAAGALDCESDLYSFNFNGYTGKFIFDENQTPRLLTDADLKIAVVYNPAGFGSFTYWVITTPDGAKYYFGENNTNEITNPYAYLSGSDPDAIAPTGWFLTRIVYPNTKDTVYFKYTAENYLYYDLGPESKLYNFTQPSTPGVPSVCLNSPTQNPVRTTINSFRLTNIQSKNYNIVFVGDTSRSDIPRPYTYKQLDSIKINNTAGQCLQQYAFHYTYWQASYSTNCNYCNVFNPSWQIDSSDSRRLKLLSVKEVSGDGTITKPPYSFLYQDSFQLPRRLSYDQDHWGYSNFSQGNYNPFFTPAVTLPGVTNCSLLADRGPRWPQMQSATLLSIRDPLGVTTKFQFEANSAFYYNIVGGLRIRQIQATDSVTGMQTVRSYTYKGGVLFKAPNYLTNLQNEYYIVPTAYTETPGYQGYSYTNAILGMLKQSQSLVPMQDAQGNHIGYTSVTEIFGVRGQGGSKTYTYQMNLNPHGDSRLSINNFASMQYVNTIFNGNAYILIGNQQFNNILPQNLQYYNGYAASLYYPIAPDQDDEVRGKLSNEFTYDSLGLLLRTVYNVYSTNYHEYLWTRGLKVYSIPGSQNQNNNAVLGSTVGAVNAITFYKLHTGISHLINSKETDYKDGKVMTTIHSYGYEDTLHTQQTSDSSVTSQGDSIIKKTYYSFDYANSATSDNVFGKMKIRNLLLPVSTRLWKNNQLIKGTVTKFQDFASSSADTFVNPAKIYSLETSSPLTPSQAAEGIAFTSLWPSLLPNAYFIEKADFNFNGTTSRIIEQRLTNDKNQALIWDNVNMLPLAQVENAYFADVAYCSFETVETGNWTFNAASVVSDATAPTGAHAYSLSGSLSKSALNTAQSYILSYWLKSGASLSVSGATQSNSVTGRTLNGYTYHEVRLTLATSISITGSGNVDELRLYPSTGQMTSYTYDPSLRLIAECSPNSTISYYDYDSINRLVDIRDQFGNVVKAFEYNYGRLSRPSL